MAKVLLATFGSLGDVHPKISLGQELKKRGHDVTIAAMEFYRERIGLTGLDFVPLAPHLDPEDKALAVELMDARRGSEKIIREIIFGNIREQYDDLITAVAGKDVLITGEIVYAVKSVVEKTSIKWVSTSLQPGTFFSAHDPFIPPAAPWIEHLRFMPPIFFRAFFGIMRRTIADWYPPYKKFRRELGLTEDHDPIFNGKYSPLLHLAMFSRVLAEPQPDWPPNTLQTGFCFYDGKNDTGKMPDELEGFLAAGGPPIVFTLGSAAVMDPRDFFTESAKAAKDLGRRAVLLYGVFNDPPDGLADDIVAFDYAPYSLVFPEAACVVHQGGVGTTAQVLRAGVPHLVMPYAHDQFDNAARCRRLGVAEVISRDGYTAASAKKAIAKILADESYSEMAAKYGEIIRSEHGSSAAADAIEKIL